MVLIIANLVHLSMQNKFFYHIFISTDIQAIKYDVPQNVPKNIF